MRGRKTVLTPSFGVTPSFGANGPVCDTKFSCVPPIAHSQHACAQIPTFPLTSTLPRILNEELSDMAIFIEAVFRSMKSLFDSSRRFSIISPEIRP